MISLTPLKSIFSLLSFDTLMNSRADLDLPNFQRVFNERLSDYIDAECLGYKSIAAVPLATESLDHVTQLILHGGKRLRPYLCYLAYATEHGRDVDEVLRIGVALELFHAFALIHDDIIDRGKERHGMLTTHQYVESIVGKDTRGDKKHISESVAMLAGDLVFSWSQLVISTSRNSEIKKIFSKMIEEVVVGQMIDVSFMLKHEVDTESILLKNELKTARYSFVNPMLMGAALAQSTRRSDLYTQFGLVLGQAYQIQDDLLDVLGNSGETGKSTFTDIQEGQHTLLTQYVLENGKPEEKEILMSMFGKPIDDHTRKVLSWLFESTGAINYARNKISELFHEAEELINNSDLRDVDRGRWLSVVSMLNKRNS